MKAAVMGYGTIGSGVVEVLDINGSSIAKRVGEPVEIKYVLDLRDFPGDPIQDKIVHDYKTIEMCIRYRSQISSQLTVSTVVRR